MPILDREGKVYSLRGPNPIMESQDTWDYSQIILLNFKPETPIILPDSKRPNRIVTERKLSPAEEFLQELSMPDPVAEVIILDEEEEEGDAQLTVLMREHSILFLCIPVTNRTQHDSVYGDRYISQEYGEQIELHAIITDESDLALEFWSPVQLQPKTVVFPQNFKRRCWKVERSEENSGGHLHFAVPSEVNPSFKPRFQR